MPAVAIAPTPIEANVAAVDLHCCHVRNRNGCGIDGMIEMVADEPDQRDQHEIGENSTGAKNEGTAQAHHVAQSQNEADGVEA